MQGSRRHTSGSNTGSSAGNYHKAASHLISCSGLRSLAILFGAYRRQHRSACDLRKGEDRKPPPTAPRQCPLQDTAECWKTTKKDIVDPCGLLPTGAHSATLARKREGRSKIGRLASRLLTASIPSLQRPWVRLKAPASSLGSCFGHVFLVVPWGQQLASFWDEICIGGQCGSNGPMGCRSPAAIVASPAATAAKSGATAAASQPVDGRSA